MKSRFWILMGLIVASLAAMVFFTGGRKNTAIVLADVTAVIKDPGRYEDQELRVRGFVKPGSVVRYGEKADFVMTLDGQDLKVHFNGETQLPDSFADNAPVRADGRLTAERAMVSHKLEAKCASKYEADYAKRRDMSSARLDQASQAQGHPQ